MDPLSRVAGAGHIPNLRIGWGTGAMFAFLGACAVATLLVEGPLADAAGVAGVLLGTVASGVLLIRNASVLEGRERLAWILIGSGLLSAAGGVLSIALVFTIVGDAAAFGLPDLFFFVTYMLMIAGFGTLPHTQGSTLGRWRMLIDGLIGAVSVGALLWVFLLEDVMHDFGSLSNLERAIGTIYPFLDLLVFTVALLVLLRRSMYRFDTRMALFTIGVAVQVIGDIMYLASARSGSFEQASPPYAINIIGLTAFFIVALLIRKPLPTREYADRNPPLWTILAPYLPAAGMLAAFFLDTFRTSAEDINVILLSATIIVGLLVVARQGVAIIENRLSIEQQRDTLVSTISHELRTPLTAIVGFVELLEEGEESIDAVERRAMLEIVGQQAVHMSRIVSDLIMLARDAGDELELVITRISMRDLAQRSVQASGIAASSVDVDCPSDLEGFVDASRIQQVLVNLLTNAERYGGQERKLQLRARGSDLVLEVHDNGSGIPRRYEVSVWDRFERGPNRLNAEVPGSGIGLAIVEAIANAHGGTAKYRESELLGGACFSVDLPGRANSTVVPATDDLTPNLRPNQPVG